MMHWRIVVVTVLFCALATASFAHAQSYQESWRVDSFAESAATRNLTAVHSYNPGEKRLGEPFWVSATAWSDAEVINMPDPLLFYRLDDPLGSATSVDAGPGARHGTILGNPVFGANAQFATGLLLDGVDDRISVADDAGLDATSLSFALWVYLDAVQNNGFPRIVDKRDATSGWSLEFRRDTNAFSFATCTATCGSATTLSLYPEGAWYHVVVTYDAASNLAVIYVGSVVAASVTMTSDPLANTQPLVWGTSVTAGSDLTGILDNIRLWGVALTPVQARFVAGSSVGPTYPWVTQLSVRGCTIDNETESYGGQYQFSRAWMLTPKDTTCTWVGGIQYHDPGVPVNPALDIKFTGSVPAYDAQLVRSLGAMIVLPWVVYFLLVFAVAAWPLRVMFAMLGFLLLLAPVPEGIVATLALANAGVVAYLIFGDRERPERFRRSRRGVRA